MRIIKFFIISFFTFFLILRNIFSIFCAIFIVKKCDVIFFNDGGFGHYIQDIVYLNYHFKNKKKIILYFLNHNNNTLLKKCVNEIDLFNLKTFISLPLSNKTIYIYGAATIFQNFIFKLINIFFKNKIFIKNYQQLDNLFINDKQTTNELKTNLSYYYYDKIDFNKRNYIGAYFAHKIDLNEYDIDFKFQNSIKNQIYKKLNKYKLQNKKLVTFYYRNKKQIDGKRLVEVRNGGDIRNYFKGFKYLVENNYAILINGDVDYLHKNNFYKLIKNKFGNNILFSNDLNLRVDEFFIFSIFNSNFFIGNSGGGSYFHLYSNQPGLILDYFPYWTTIKNSVIYFKPMQDHNGSDIKINKNILSQINIYENEKSINVRPMTSNEIYLAIKDFYTKFKNLKIVRKNKKQLDFHNNLPEWFFLKIDNNSIISDEFIKNHWDLSDVN